MAERAVTARMLAHADPRGVDIDDEMLPWVFDPNQGVWLSFDGNYSQTSPGEKRSKHEAWMLGQEEWLANRDEIARQQYENNMAWSMIRQTVLERDNYCCQICDGLKGTTLHIHHILKRVEGGTDHLDNLITVCNRCHKSADTKFYDPDWTQQPTDTLCST